jgi:hypothetical protein
MKIDQTVNSIGVTTRLIAVRLSREEGGGFEVREVPRRSPAADEVEVAVEAASVNPIDVRRADGYGRPLLSGGRPRYRLAGAARHGNHQRGVLCHLWRSFPKDARRSAVETEQLGKTRRRNWWFQAGQPSSHGAAQRPCWRIS